MKLPSAIREWFSKGHNWLNRSPLHHWTFHVCVSAAPSFAFGFAIEPKPQRFLGMVFGVLFFISLYTLAARWTFPRGGELPLWRRAIRLGTWIRTTSSLLVWVGVPVSFFWTGQNPLMFLFMPDLLAGLVAHSTAEKLTEIAGGSAVGLKPEDSVVFTFLVTVIEGFLLSGLLFLIAFICLWVLTIRARRLSNRLGNESSAGVEGLRG